MLVSVKSVVMENGHQRVHYLQQYSGLCRSGEEGEFILVIIVILSNIIITLSSSPHSEGQHTFQLQTHVSMSILYISSEKWGDRNLAIDLL